MTYWGSGDSAAGSGAAVDAAGAGALATVVDVAAVAIIKINNPNLLIFFIFFSQNIRLYILPDFLSFVY